MDPGTKLFIVYITYVVRITLTVSRLRRWESRVIRLAVQARDEADARECGVAWFERERTSAHRGHGHLFGTGIRDANDVRIAHSKFGPAIRAIASDDPNVLVIGDD